MKDACSSFAELNRRNFDTIIEDEDKNMIIIPNSMISNGVIKNIKNKTTPQ